MKNNDDEKFRIGLVVGNVDENFTNQICKGAMRATELLGDDLFIIPMNYLNVEFKNPSPDLEWEYQYNFMAAYAQEARLDLVILCYATITCLATPSQASYLLDHFGDTPVFLLASDDENHSSIKYDNKSGFIDGIEYLINERGCNHVCLLSGPKSNKDSMERYEAYMEVMRNHGMPTDDSRVAYGYLNMFCEAEVEDLLIRNPEVDAIVCANDLMARTVYKVLKKYKFEIGRDVCVLGFDDMEDSEIQEPPLASVSAEASSLGYRAFVEAHRLLSEYGRDNFPVVHFEEKTSFINRESACGVKYDEIAPFGNIQKKQYRQEIIKMESLDHKMNILSRDMLTYESSSDQAYGSFLKALCPIKEISDCYLFTFNKPIPYYANEKWELPESIYLRAYKHGDTIIEMPSSRQRVKIKDLFYTRYFGDEAKNYVLIDIYCRELQYGVMICSLPYEMFHYVETLCYQISIALKIKDLFAAKEKLLEERDDMLYMLEKENSYLDTISYYDELTGILNRRGFNNEMTEYLEDKNLLGSRCVIIIGDLNFLKQINDKFGHEEGDFALKTAAEALSHTMAECGFASRIGGDEYLCFGVLSKDEEPGDVKRKVKKYLRDFNKKSKKPYEVKLSLGTVKFELTADLDVEALISKADHKLYDDKRKKGDFIIRK